MCLEYPMSWHRIRIRLFQFLEESRIKPMKAKIWIVGYFVIFIGTLSMIGWVVYDVDPFFHYHKPQTDKYFYLIDNERSQNDGIIRHFQYDALITGTSMTENFKCSEMDDLFGVNSVKVPFSGGTYKEINDNVRNALRRNSALKIVVRGLDMTHFFQTYDAMRSDLGIYPTYLYDDNPLNDVRYLWNRDVLFNRVCAMLGESRKEGFVPGITDFDSYANWQSRYTYGVHAVCPDGIAVTSARQEEHLTEEEKAVISENIYQNVISLPMEYPDVDFYYFFTPYSVVYWGQQIENNDIYRWIEAEQYIIELLLPYENIKLYSFNNRWDLVTDLNHYKDTNHYGGWINSAMLHWMKDGQYLLTAENYRSYLNEELDFWLSFEYESLNEQEDYENDLYADALLSREFSGTEPVNLLSGAEQLNLAQASLVLQEDKGIEGIVCVGRLDRDAQDNAALYDYLYNDEYIGARIVVPQAEQYRYLVFDGKKNAGHGQPSVYVYNSRGEKIAECCRDYAALDGEYHQYLLDLSQVEGDITIIFNGGYTDRTGDEESSYTFSNIWLY